jgi:dUTP pyrophosphatase
MKVKIKLIDGGKMPEYKTKGAACCDAYARLITPYITIPKGARCLINLGVCFGLPDGYEAVIRPRSGNSGKGLDIIPGTIDADYTGEIKACVVNNTGGDIDVKNLERICQIKIQEAQQFEFVEVDEIEATERGDGGFGHTGRM